MNSEEGNAGKERTVGVQFHGRQLNGSSKLSYKMERVDLLN